ncbi:uncharacterized protein BDR25DRAFT_344688 [Lindgomyces ingoldianus]|uniref:Uncharacterized protein n=1 Tax=Lindgomyces ingoldianus TaxID=673940 RepID=A0ACB6QN76_9PLEO|nr:uncharacterized protein BDR25DRAFT_344688 [Lindgomyces ingoldianus]KAF2467980.1 hypothetical protein BDR25DRAFT_344688 [Lindgomyces ingoldianus]
MVEFIFIMPTRGRDFPNMDREFLEGKQQENERIVRPKGLSFLTSMLKSTYRKIPFQTTQDPERDAVSMERIPIAELSPELASVESKQFKAVVTLVWPYSSSTRQCALLLAEHDFRLRRKKGQVRVRFSGAAAKALAETGIGISDDVELGLQGAQFVENDAEVSTPGKSVDWELAYSLTLIVKIYRDGNEIANLDIHNASPVRQPGQQPILATPIQTIRPPSDMQQWSTPVAFLKRARLLDGPSFGAGYDPLAQDGELDNDRKNKRRRKSYKDWGVWTYSARTPSPEKEDVDMEDEYDEILTSPIRQTLLPATPVLPPKPRTFSVATPPLKDSGGEAKHDEPMKTSLAFENGVVEKRNIAEKTASNKSLNDDFVRDADYYDLYAGPNEYPPSEVQYAYGGDTESNTEEDGSQEGHRTTEILNVAEVGSEEPSHDQQPHETAKEIEVISTSKSSYVADGKENARPSREDRVLEHTEIFDDDIVDLASDGRVHAQHESPLHLDTPIIVMPPPTLPSLQTDFPSTLASGMLTPIGQEPQSPVIKPLDSSTLPLPSPFPGDRDGNGISYLDRPGPSYEYAPSVGTSRQEQETLSEASYFVESSFYSSVSAANASTVHPTHESAFTDVRFQFGIDGSVFSREKAPLKSPSPEDVYTDDESHPESAMVRGGSLDWMANQKAHQMKEAKADELIDRKVDQRVNGMVDGIAQEEPNLHEAFTKSEANASIVEPIHMHQQLDSVSAATDSPRSASIQSTQPEVVVISSDDEIDSSTDVSQSDSEMEDDAELASLDDENLSTGDGDDQEDAEQEETHRSGVLSQVIDLGSDSEDDSDDNEEAKEGPAATINKDENEDFRPSGPFDPNTIEAETFHCSPSRASALRETQQGKENAPYAGRGDMSAPMAVLDNTDRNEDSGWIDTDEVDVHQSQLPSTIATGNQGKVQGGDFNDNDLPIAMNERGGLSPDAMSTQGAIPETLDTVDHDPDVKMESIEEESSFLFNEPDHSQMQDEDEDSVAGSSTELTIAVPEEGHKLGELQLKTVAATGPSRNTRSKTKASLSPVKNDTPASQNKPQSRRTKTSLTSVVRATQSPSRTTRSTISTVKGRVPASSYGLRSRSKNPSPMKIAPSKSIASPESPRRSQLTEISSALSSHLKDAFAKLEPTPFEPIEFPDTSFGPSQELGAIQGKFANVSFVRDSEEGSFDSAHSLSTIPYSDDFDGFGTQTYLDLSDSGYPTANTRDAVAMYPTIPPTDGDSATEVNAQPEAKTKWKDLPPNSVSQDRGTQRRPSYSSITHKSFSSPIKLRGARRNVYHSSPDPPEVLAVSTDELLGEVTPKVRSRAKQIAYPELPVEAIVQVPSSPPAAIDPEWQARMTTAASEDNEERIPSSPPPIGEAGQMSTSVNQQSLMNSNMPITPDATQQSFIESQPTFQTMEQNLPMTPELTQNTSAGLRTNSFKSDVEMEEVSAESLIKPPPIAKTTLRHNTTSADTASRDISPSIHSEDLSNSDDEAGLATNLSPPSIGLSTPLQYYTPLKDLSFYLNRSSQLHPASNPDVLALVTSPTTPAKRAEKGPRDWHTTLQITDLSSFPSTTTVQVFRVYSMALPVAQPGDVILLRKFLVRGLNRKEILISGEESAWCVWRYGRLLWGKKSGEFGEVRAREEVKGPAVERGRGEWREVEKLRGWWLGSVQLELEGRKEKEKENGMEMRWRVNREFIGKGKGKGKEKEKALDGVPGDVET